MSSTEPRLTGGWKGTAAHPQESLISMTDLFGRKWCPVVLYRLLRDGPMGFSDLKRDIDGISGKMLTESLETLETGYGLVERSVMAGACAFCAHRYGAEGTCRDAGLRLFGGPDEHGPDVGRLATDGYRLLTVG